MHRLIMMRLLATSLHISSGFSHQFYTLLGHIPPLLVAQPITMTHSGTLQHFFAGVGSVASAPPMQNDHAAIALKNKPFITTLLLRKTVFVPADAGIFCAVSPLVCPSRPGL